MKNTRLNRKRKLFLILSTLLLAAAVANHPAAPPEPILPSEPYTVTLSGALAKYDLDTLMERSSLVAFGTVTGAAPSFYVQCVGGGTQMLTPYTVRLDRVLLGRREEEETVEVRLFGGTVGNRTEVYEESPVLEPDKQYLLFLYQPGHGGGYHTEGDYFYINGMYQGAYQVCEDGIFRSAGGTILTESQLIIPAALLDGPGYDDREACIQIWRQNLEGGIITQEAFDQAMAQMDQYAVVMGE